MGDPPKSSRTLEPGTALIGQRTRPSLKLVFAGMSERRVVEWHVLRKALVLVITIIGLQFGSLMGQAVVVEKLFAWPGVGSLLIDSVFQRDMPAVQGCILLIVLFFLAINTLVDIAYVAIDSRIRHG